MSLFDTIKSMHTLADFNGGLTIAMSFVHGTVFSLLFSNQLAVTAWVYTGILMSLIMTFISAAYVVTKTVDAGVKYTGAFISAYAATYLNGVNAWGDNLGLFELIALLMFCMWSMMMSFAGLYTSYDLWGKMDARTIGVKNEGSGGVALDDVQAVKIFTLCMIMGVMSIVGGFSLGDVADKLITWFDQYATKTGEQANVDGTLDPKGQSAMYDIIYHYVTLAAGYMVFTVITGGAFVFGYNFLDFTHPVNCDFNAVDSSAKNEALGPHK